MKLTRPLAVLTVLAVIGAFSSGSASAASLPAGTTAILSGDLTLSAPLPAPVAGSEIRNSSASQDGRLVAFQSRSDGLYDGDDDSVSNIYVKDRATGAVVLASRASGAAGEPSHSYCYQPSISDDGTRVAFVCSGPLGPADTNGPNADVYLRDLTTSTTLLVSRAGNLGAVGNSASSSPSVSDSGEYVAFESEASNLDPAATQSGRRVYRRRIGGDDATVVVTRKNGATGAPASGYEPSISDDGSRVAFIGQPNEAIDPADTNAFADVYVRDVAAGSTILASRADGAGAVGNGYSWAPAIAGNGTAVVFESTANQFDNMQDPDAAADIYRRSLISNTTALVDVTAGGQKGTISTRPSIDDSGNVVGFVSSGTALDADDTDAARDAYVKNVATNEIRLVSRLDGTDGKAANAGATIVAVSGDGTKVAIGLDTGTISPGLDPRQSSVVLRDFASSPQRTVPISRPQGDAPFVNEGGFATDGVLSADGRYAAFISGAPALGLPDGVRSAVFVRDRVTGEVRVASRADGASGAPLRVGTDEAGLAISDDGRRVAFSVESGPDRGIWVRDLAAGRTFLASRADGAGGAPADGSSQSPALDADGSRVAFTSYAENLGDGDTDTLGDIHVRDLGTGRTILASRGADGAKSNGGSDHPDMNADGTRVTFDTYATNLADGDTDDKPDIHLRDLGAETTLLVSAIPGGEKSNGMAYDASIDAAGTRVAFEAVAANFPGGSASRYEVFVRDLAAGTLALVSRADGADGAPADGSSTEPLISPDGGYVVFGSEAANLAPGVPGSYLRALGEGRTELISRANGPDGRPATRSWATGISADGACVSFYSEDALVGPPSDYAQIYLRVRRADCGDQPADARDTTAPVLSGARLSRRRFRVGRARTPLAAKLRPGTVLRFRSSEAGTASVTFARIVRRHGRTHLRRAGRLTRKVSAGRARIALSGRVGRRAMRAGRYRLTLQVSDAAGNRSRPVRLRFRVAR
jgi:Tol biopolymer transport system component